MRTPSSVALAFVYAASFAAADCFSGSNARPDKGLEVIQFFYAAGCELQQSELASGTEFKKSAKSTDGKCLNVLVKNHGTTQAVSSDMAVDAWTREWVGCEHGGERKYDDSLEYVWHLDCY